MYEIRRDYQHRKNPREWDDMPYRDEYQREVYRLAALLAPPELPVLDLGCGSGYKLLKYFPDHETVGVELPKYASRLRRAHPDRRWLDWVPYSPPTDRFGLLICADVIEHVADPDELLDWIEDVPWSIAVISTPARPDYHTGPPRNRHHVREWSVAEFSRYLSARFRLVAHVAANPPRNTCQACVLRLGSD